jgi:hypothetical protein
MGLGNFIYPDLTPYAHSEKLPTWMSRTNALPAITVGMVAGAGLAESSLLLILPAYFVARVYLKRASDEITQRARDVAKKINPFVSSAARKYVQQLQTCADNQQVAGFFGGVGLSYLLAGGTALTTVSLIFGGTSFLASAGFYFLNKKGIKFALEAIRQDASENVPPPSPPAPHHRGGPSRYQFTPLPA